MAVLNIFSASCLARSSTAAMASYMIRSAVDFLPRIIMMLTNFATSRLPYFGIRQHLALRRARPPHGLGSPFGALAPYFERLCLRPATPAVSSEPRMMW